MSIRDLNWWEWTVFFPLCGSVWSHVPWPLFSVSCFRECFAASVMQMLKSLTSPWKLTAQLYAKVLQSPHEGICAHSLHVSVNVCVTAREEKENMVKRAERVSLGLLSCSITTRQVIPLHSEVIERALFVVISVQILVQSFTQLTCSCLPLFAFIVTDSLAHFSVLLRSVTVHRYYSTTARPHGPETLPFSHFTVNTNTQCDV